MRYICLALALLISSAATAAAQGDVRLSEFASRVSPDLVIARMMTFDRDRDGRVAVRELSERMQGLVARGDKSGDGALDESEIRQLATAKQFVRIQGLGSGYGFADTTLSSRSHIKNSIDDLRLAPDASEEAKRIAIAFVDEFEAASTANLRQALALVITEEHLAQLEASLARTGVPIVNGMISSAPVAPPAAGVSRLLVRLPVPSEQMKAVAAAADAFRAERQFDDTRRSELVSRLSGLLTGEESDNLSAALARRPLVKRAGSFPGFPALNAEHGLTIDTAVR